MSEQEVNSNLSPGEHSESYLEYIKPLLERIKELESTLEIKTVELEDKDRMLSEAFQNHVHFNSFKKLKQLTDEKIERLNEVIEEGVKITETRMMNQILAAFLDSLMQLFSLDKVSVFFKKQGSPRSKLKIVAGRGIATETIMNFRLQNNEGLAGWAYANDVADLVYDASRDERFLIRKGHKARRETVLVVPIRIDKKPIGVVCAEKMLTTSKLFTRNDMDYMVILTNFAAAAFKNARVYQRLQSRYRETYKLMEISEAITSTLKLDEVLKLILQNLSKIIGVHRCSIMLLDDEEQTLNIKASLGLKKVYRKRKIKVGEGIAGWVAKTGEALLIEDIAKHRFYKKTGKEGYISKSLLSVPIRYKNKIIGVLNITNKKDQRAFTEDDQRLVTYYSDQVSIAIENANLYAQVEKLATTDSLTGLANHRYFQDVLKDSFAFAKEKALPLSLIMMDVDNFKLFNDSHGHLAGDKVLRTIGSTILEALQKDDFFASRYGGEEFTVILPGIPLEKAFRITENLRKKVNQTTVQIGEQTLTISISCGVAQLEEGVELPQQLIDHADQAMYVAKRQGKNRTALYEPAAGATASHFC